MKILLATRAMLSAITGSPIRGRNLALCLAEQGAHVVTVSPGPCVHAHENLTHVTCDSEQKFFEYVSTQGSSFDILICLTVWQASLILYAARRANLPCVVDCHGLGVVEELDPYHGRPLDVERMHNCIAWDIAAMRADGIIAANPAILEWCRRAFVPVCDAVGLTNVSRFSDIPATARSAKSVRVLYSGGSSYWQGIETFLEAIPLVLEKSDDFSFHVQTRTEPGSPLENLLQEMSAAGMITREPYRDFEQYPAFLARYDIGVIPRRVQPASYQSFPQKLVDYMAGGLCVVATDVYPFPEVFSSGERGLCASPHAEGIAKAILALHSPQVRRLFGANARRYARERFDWKTRGPVIMDFLRDRIDYCRAWTMRPPKA